MQTTSQTTLSVSLHSPGPFVVPIREHRTHRIEHMVAGRAVARGIDNAALEAPACTAATSHLRTARRTLHPRTARGALAVAAAQLSVHGLQKRNLVRRGAAQLRVPQHLQAGESVVPRYLTRVAAPLAARVAVQARTVSGAVQYVLAASVGTVANTWVGRQQRRLSEPAVARVVVRGQHSLHFIG